MTNPFRLRRPFPTLAASLTFVLFALAALPAAGQSERGDRANEAQPNRDATVSLIDGQAVVGRLVEPEVTVRTRYGVLKVPFTDVLAVRLAPRLGPEKAAAFSALAAGIESSAQDSAKVEGLVEGLKPLGVSAFHAESQLHAKLADGPAKDALQRLLDEHRSRDGVYLESSDEVVSRRFTMRGDIVEERFHLDCVFGRLEVPVHDVVRIAFEELEVRKTWKVTAQHVEQQGLLDTGCKVRKGQKFKLTPSGNMTWQGQSFGPEGLRHHTWNDRNMGCLQWRVGNGPWQILGSAFDGKAPDAGNLHFCVHLTGGGATSGEFKVVFESRMR